MTIYDAQNNFSSDQDFEAESTNSVVYSTNDLKVGPGDFGQGNELMIDVIVTEDFDNIVSLKVGLVTDSVLPIDGSSVVLYETPAIVLASLVAGYKFKIKGIPPGCDNWIALKYTLAGGTDPNAGMIEANIVRDTQDSDLSF